MRSAELRTERVQIDKDKRVKRATSQCWSDLEGMVRHIKPVAAWEHLVYPQSTLIGLRHICSDFRPGKGLICLFAGESGTGKALAAEVLAKHLGIDLLRIDLSAVVSKYIGETEKNLQSIFYLAETTNTILLFDEADSLFGRRSEVKDSHDRYANVEINYLLQRMQAYKGLTILATNKKHAFGAEFLRRFRYIIDFPGL
jgi:SpoVK/Ycf46/Vps4 family AAA+-type ATPase